MPDDAAIALGHAKARLTVPPGAASVRGDHGASYAAIDLGTNNCRLLVGAPCARADAQGFRVVDSFSRIVRLGEGLAATGRLSDVAMERALHALRGCAEKLARRPVRGVQAVATEACRRAANGPEFAARVERETGLRLRIIAAREEAELAMESCGPLLGDADRRVLLFDIGGGSTEIAWIRVRGAEPPEMIGYISLPMGVVTLAERFGAQCFTEVGFSALVTDIAGQLAGFDAVHSIGREIQA
ncbi:MAG: Ppx/GppA family phosphatase, partial [Rhodospirillales bacterium]|nr:Ppx/GppA family phosphatase [Rhodospirillales bacterium]